MNLKKEFLWMLDSQQSVHQAIDIVFAHLSTALLPSTTPALEQQSESKIPALEPSLRAALDETELIPKKEDATPVTEDLALASEATDKT
jgi:hypothetical protein